MHRYVQGSVAEPAAGADLTEVPNYGDTFRLLSLRATLVTSSTTASRYPHFKFVSPSGNVVHELVPSTAQVASKTVVYQLVGGNGAAYEGSATVDGLSSCSLPDLWWPAGTKVETATTAIDAGDQWSDIYFSMLVGEEQATVRLLSDIAHSLG